MIEKIVLIDGHSILHRAFYGMPELTNAEGLHTNAVYGFLNIMFKILDEEQPKYLAVAFDLHAPTFRHQMFDAYKGTRKPMPEELREQVPVMKETLKAMNIPVITKEGYEADDLLGTLSVLCERQGLLVSIVSGDRDLLQLATEQVKVRIPKTKRTGTEIEDYNKADVLEKYQVTPQEFIDVKALMGDASDNIPGVPGIGEKTATKLIVQYHSLEGVYEHLEEMKAGKVKNALLENSELAKLSKKLSAICVDAPLDFTLEDALLTDFNTEEAEQIFQKLEFKNLLKRLGGNKRTEQQTLPDFMLVTDFAQAESLFSEAAKQAYIGFCPLMEQELLGVALCLSKETTCFIKTGGFLTESYVRSKCEQLFEQDLEIAVMDLKETLQIFWQLERREIYEKILDVSLEAYLINPLKSDYAYNDVAKEHLDLFIESERELKGKQDWNDILKLQPDNLLKYACGSAYVAFCLGKDLLQKLQKLGMLSLYQNIERPLCVTLCHMEREGIIADQSALCEYSENLGAQIEQLQQDIYKLAGEEFNINSPKQLGEILFVKMGLPNGKKTKTGYSTSAEVLEKLEQTHEIIPLILEYRQLSKLKSTYADGLVQYIDQSDGRIHSTFQQKVTATGRISSIEPNLQNIPIRMELGRLIRKVFVAREGCEFVDADYSQIELRVLAHLSGDEKLIEAYNKNEDIHRITASEVFHIPFEQVTPLQRRNAKAVNFGIVYGISSFGLSQDLSISRKEAAEYIDKYFETYPQVKNYIDSLVSGAKENGYVTTLYGRRRPIPELKSSQFMTRSFGERAAMNSPVQGTAADIIKIAMIRVDERLRKEGLLAKLLLQVHDELLIESPFEETERVKQILSEEMRHAADLKVKLEIDMHTGKDWFEAK